ncbi:unnamed protein product [Boreogadus saida]
MAATSKRKKVYQANDVIAMVQDSFHTGDELDSSDTHQAPSNDYENETVVEIEENAPCQDSFSDGADNTFNTPIEDAEEVEQTRPHLEEDSSADDDIADPL